MPNTAECIGVILAGGASTRMGTDKASLLWHGVPMHQHLRAVLLAAGAGRVILSGRAELDGGLADQNPGQGPLAALASVVNSIAPQKAWLLVLAVDTPKLAAHTLQLLRPPGELDYHCFQEHVLPFGVQLNDKTRQTVLCAA